MIHQLYLLQIGIIQKAIDITVSGSRQGFYVAELHLLICKAFAAENGIQNLEKLWYDYLELAEWFYNRLINLLSPFGYSQQSIVYDQLRLVIPAPATQDKTDYLGQKYGLMPVGSSQLGIYVFPRVTKEYLEGFLNDYMHIMRG